MPNTRFRCRWMIRTDVPEVLLADAGALEPWDEESLLATLRPHHQIGMVAEDEYQQVVGFFVYGLHKGRLQLLRIGVCPEWRRQGVGKAMLAKLVGKVHVPRDRITADVPEREVGCQLFLRACGWRCTEVVPTAGDAVYLFQRRVAASVNAPC